MKTSGTEVALELIKLSPQITPRQPSCRWHWICTGPRWSQLIKDGGGEARGCSQTDSADPVQSNTSPTGCASPLQLTQPRNEALSGLKRRARRSALASPLHGGSAERLDARAGIRRTEQAGTHLWSTGHVLVRYGLSIRRYEVPIPIAALMHGGAFDPVGVLLLSFAPGLAQSQDRASLT